MRCIVVAILITSGYLLWQDYPSPAPEQPAASGGSFYYQHDVWIGVVEPNEFAQAVFFAPGPTLIVHPTGDGWSGYLHFIIGSQSASASGHLVMLLPLTAKIGKSRSSFVSVSVQSATSEKLVYIYISIPRNTIPFTYNLPVTWSDPASAQRLGFGETRYFLYIGNAYVNHNRIYSVTPYVSDRYRAKDGSATEDTPTATVTVETAGSHEVFTNYSQPESLYSTSSALQYAVDPGDGGSLAGLGLFRAVSVTIENSDDSFYMQLASNVFFVAIGFLLSEVAVLAEKRRKDRRAAAEPN